MKNTVKVNQNEVELSHDLLVSFAKFLSPEITKFYHSDEGKAYYKKWMEQHPEYAASNNYTVIGEYIDRAQTGKNDHRFEFQRMLTDSEKHTFEGVLVYQLDRFARNRYDSAINKAKLKRNGVRVISAKENIADDPSGILVEGVLESMAEYYSAALSQKINHGMEINAEKCISNGSNPGLGYKVDSDRHFYVDPDEAAIVREIYERHAAGETKAEIIRDLQRRKIKTSIGKEFIEDRVIAECLKMLTDENIAFIAKMIVEECKKDPDNLTVKEIKKLFVKQILPSKIYGEALKQASHPKC